VCISKMEWKTYPKRRDVEYDDFVYCVEVPSGCIVTRRGKRTAISGNCIHRKAYHSLVQALNIDSEEIYKYPETKGRIKYLEKYLENDPKIIGKKRILKRLILFTALVERINLFTQFYILTSFSYHSRGLETIGALQKSTAQEE